MLSMVSFLAREYLAVIIAVPETLHNSSDVYNAIEQQYTPIIHADIYYRLAKSDGFLYNEPSIVPMM